MPKFKVTLEDGRSYAVTVPEGQGQREAHLYARRMAAQSPKPKEQSFTDKAIDWVNTVSPIGWAADVAAGRQNRVRAGIAQGVANVGDKLAGKLESGYNALAGVTGLPKSTGGQNPAFSQATAKLGPGNKTARTLGEIAAAAYLTRRVPGGAFGQGAASAGIMSDADSPLKFATDVALGGAGGYATNRAVGAAAGLIAPQVNNAARYLHNRGVRLTPGQASPALQRTEERLTSRPFVGDRITAGRQQSYRDFNRVAIQDTLTPVGVQLPPNLEGNAAVRFAGDQLSNRYERLVPQLRLVPDQQLATDLQAVQGTVQGGDLSPAAIARFNQIVQNQVAPRLNGAQPLTGEAYRQIERNLGRQIARFSRSQEPDNQAMAEALEQMQGAFQGALQRSNPQHAPQLEALNTGWANLVRVEGAASGARGGLFSPQQFRMAVRRGDNTTRGRGMARGEARMQDLAEAAVDVLPSDYPDSGTSGRSQMNPFDPRYYLGMAQGLAYGPGTQQTITNALLAPRPQSAQTIADLLRLAPSGAIGAAGSNALLSGGW